MTGLNPAVVDLSGGNLVLVVIVALIALGALGMAAMFRSEVLAAGEGTDNMKNIAQAVQEGANAYLHPAVPHARRLRRGRVPAAAGAARRRHLACGSSARSSSWSVPASPPPSATSACPSPCAPTSGSPRPPRAEGREPAMRIGFRTGAMVGMLTVGLGLLGAAIVVLGFGDEAPDVLEGFGFGAALLAMFMRVGGGIFTKAADVGADLVGKVEQNIPEDDPRNAATIADNVGDNVGDCAGMAADLFESYAVTLVAALILGSQAFGDKGLVFPLLIPAIGALTAVLGVYLCQAQGRRERPDHDQPGVLHLRRRSPRSPAWSLSFVYLPTLVRRASTGRRQQHPRPGLRHHQRGQPRADRLGRRRHRHRDGRRPSWR